MHNLLPLRGGETLSYKELPHGEHLRAKWRKILREPHSRVWSDFDQFYTWAIAHGYGPDRQIRRTDKSKPWRPGNCKVVDAKPDTRDDGFGSLWDATVAAFRRRLAWAGANDPAAIIRLLNGVPAAIGPLECKKAAPGSTSPESGARKISTC